MTDQPVAHQATIHIFPPPLWRQWRTDNLDRFVRAVIAEAPQDYVPLLRYLPCVLATSAYTYDLDATDLLALLIVLDGMDADTPLSTLVGG